MGSELALHAFTNRMETPIIMTIGMERMKIFGYRKLGCNNGLRSLAH